MTRPPEAVSTAAKKTGQELGAYSNALNEGPEAMAERKLRQRPAHLGELSPLTLELIRESQSELHADLVGAQSMVQGLGVLGDSVGLGLEYGLRSSGVDKGTARAIHTAYNVITENKMIQSTDLKMIQ